MGRHQGTGFKALGNKALGLSVQGFRFEGVGCKVTFAFSTLLDGFFPKAP